MDLDVKIEGKNVLITGGASGLGAAYAEAFLKSGAQVRLVLSCNYYVKLFVKKNC